MQFCTKILNPSQWLATHINSDTASSELSAPVHARALHSSDLEEQILETSSVEQLVVVSVVSGA